MISVYRENPSSVPVSDSKEEQKTFFLSLSSPLHADFYFLRSFTIHSFTHHAPISPCKIGRLLLWSLTPYSTCLLPTSIGDMFPHGAQFLLHTLCAIAPV